VPACARGATAREIKKRSERILNWFNRVFMMVKCVIDRLISAAC
jgi:hypothetical protein